MVITYIDYMSILDLSSLALAIVDKLSTPVPRHFPKLSGATLTCLTLSPRNALAWRCRVTFVSKMEPRCVIDDPDGSDLKSATICSRRQW
jgi:hypothetical protein